VTLRDSLVAENRNAGLLLASTPAVVERTVIRDTRHQTSDKQNGAGIEASARKGAASTLTLRDSTIYRNEAGGVAVTGSKATLERVVILETKQEVSGIRGFGLHAEGESAAGAEVTLRDCVLDGNREAGLNLRGSDATLERVVVRDTRSMAKDRTRGVGIQASRYLGRTATLTLREGLVTGNRLVGVDLKSSSGTIERSVIERTAPQEQDGAYGLGIQAITESASSTLESRLTLRDSLVARNHGVGVSVVGSEATIERSAVRDTAPDQRKKRDGVCLAVAGTGVPAALTMNRGLVQRCHLAGVFIITSSVKITASVIREISQEGLTRGFGDGIQIGPDTRPRYKLEHTSSLIFTGSSVEQAARVGLSFFGTRGDVSASTFRRCLLPINLAGGAAPRIAADNVFVDNKENKVSYGQGLSSAPPPELPGFGN
jgi:hypothetical protein